VTAAAVIALAPDVAERLVLTPAQELHRAIAARAFRATPASAPMRLLHDAISTGVYGAVRGGLAGAARVGAFAAEGRPAREPGPRARFALAALNGLIGDELEAQGSALALPTTLRHAGRDLPAERDALAAAHPDAGARLVVYVHGLCEDEQAWRTCDVGRTQLFVRYNSGAPVAESGRRLAELLEATVRAWPVPVEDVAVVGHSMGGLVLRSAGHHASDAGHAWVRLVRHVACLGTPHLGAPLERFVEVAVRGMRLLPEARAFAGILESRSAGIRDLHDGLPDVPLLPDARHLFVSAAVHPLVGDFLVTEASACGRDRIAMEEEDLVHLPGLNHFDLLGHPEVHARLCAWLGVA
jgi:hypothetical protein